MLTGSIITIAGFVPIGFAASSAGEYTFSIFAVVAISQMVSWFVAVLFAPVLGLAILKQPTPQAQAAPARQGSLMRGFNALLVSAMRARWITIGLTVGIFALSVWAMRFVPQQFFPASDRAELLVDLTLPQNASIHASETAVAEARRAAWRRTPMSRAGAPMSAAAPSASTCR